MQLCITILLTRDVRRPTHLYRNVNNSSTQFHIAVNSEFIILAVKTNYRQTVEQGCGPEISVTCSTPDAHVCTTRWNSTDGTFDRAYIASHMTTQQSNKCEQIKCIRKKWLLKDWLKCWKNIICIILIQTKIYYT